MTVVEPTRTKTIRQGYVRELTRNMNRAKNEALTYSKNYLMTHRDEATITKSVGEYQEAIDSIMAMYAVGYSQTTIDRYMDLSYTKGLKRADKELTKAGMSVGIDFTTPDRQALEIIKKRNLSELKGITQAVSQSVTREFFDGMRAGEGMDQLAARITDRFDKIGVTRAQTLARTEVIKATNQAAVNRYAAVGVTKWKWIVAHDERTCEICWPLDGKIFNIGDPEPPIHPNCRCSTLAVIE